MSDQDEVTCFETSLGPMAEMDGQEWFLNLENLPIFRGLSVLSKAITEQALAQASGDRGDVDFECELSYRENPELISELGVRSVRVRAELDMIGAIARNPAQFGDHLRALFGTLQKKHYREALFPTKPETPSRALLFEFVFNAEDESPTCHMLLELLPRPGNRVLRVSVENPLGRRLDMGSVPHLAVTNMGERTFIAGSTRIAQTWREGLLRQVQRGRQTYTDRRTRGSHLYQQLDQAGLSELTTVNMSWGEHSTAHIIDSSADELTRLLKKILLALEDRQLRELLSRGSVFRIALGEAVAYLDLSQHARVLNISLDGPRQRTDIEQFLEFMPATASECAAGPTLAGVSVFLVHHITSEVLGVIAALRRLGCRDLHTLFVAYAGDPPDAYLEALLDLPPEEFTAMALTSIPGKSRIEGSYRLSSQYSRLEADHGLQAALEQGEPHFFEAMQRVAKIAFLQQIERARCADRRCMIIEDGGYLAPAVNASCLSGQRVKDFLGAADPHSEDERLLTEVLAGVFVGSVEHTRNGFNRLREVEAGLGALAFPAFSIAVSRFKLDTEAREVAVSVINATDNVLNGMGLVLSRRNCLVLGSRGAIGTPLLKFLGERLAAGPARLAGVDIMVTDHDPPQEIREAASYRALPQEVRLRTDMIFGVTGTSVLDGDDISEWLLHGHAARLLLASGSTKTEEFRDVSDWVEKHLLASTVSRIQGCEVSASLHDVRDPITGRVFGHRCDVRFLTGRKGRHRQLVFLANLTPINFLFYGVPTEIIDSVLAQLLSTSNGLLQRTGSGPVPARLHAVDVDINANGEALA